MIYEIFPEFDELESTTDHKPVIADAIGDTLQETPPTNITRIHCQNLNGLSWDSEGGKWPYICETMAAIKADITCVTEINTDTNNFPIRQKMKSIASRQFHRNRLVLSTSKYSTPTIYKPGGTAIVACNAITATVKSYTRDRMGRWSSIKLSTPTSRSIRIITAYQVCANMRPGTNTAAAQQRAQIIEKQSNSTNITRVTPRESFITNLTAFILQCQSNNEDIILVGDFNDNISPTNSGMERLATATGLTDLFSIRLGSSTIPATYQRGTKRIDYALMTPMLTTQVRAAGYDPFGYRIPSDH